MIPNHAECAMRRDLDLEIEVESTSIRLRLVEHLVTFIKRIIIECACTYSNPGHKCLYAVVESVDTPKLLGLILLKDIE